MTSRRLTDNHSRGRVPAAESVSGLAIAVVIIGVGITLPAFLIGTELVGSLGLADGALAIFLGGFLMACIGYLTMRVGAETRLSTYSVIRFCFGGKGSHLVNLILAITLFGWYGVTAALFGRALAQAAGDTLGADAPPWLFTIAGGVLMVATTIYGFRAIDRLSRIAVPLLAALLLYGVWKVLGGTSLAALSAVPARADAAIASVSAGVSIVIGSFFVGVTLVPDLSRFARRRGDAVTGAFLSYGMGYPLVLLLAGLPVLVSADTDLISSMASLGLGVPALAVLVFATWTTNVNNLYSASLSVARILPDARDWLITLVCGAIGTLLALAGIMDHFIDFLILLGIIVPPIAGIYLADYFLLRLTRINAGRDGPVPDFRWDAVAAWALGCAVGFLESASGWSVTTVTAIDTLLAAMAALWLWNALRPSPRN
ncbi:MAG: cytosine permease [Gammaproteobacteria bacterium]|nr:cytosine permease [Gammaproteobacteria bacterium]